MISCSAARRHRGALRSGVRPRRSPVPGGGVRPHRDPRRHRHGAPLRRLPDRHDHVDRDRRGSRRPDETLDPTDLEVVAWRAGRARIARVDGCTWGDRGVPNVIQITYDTLEELPLRAALAIKRGAAAVFRRLGSEELRASGPRRSAATSSRARATIPSGSRPCAACARSAYEPLRPDRAPRLDGHRVSRRRYA
jgi:hypothetical protein